MNPDDAPSPSSAEAEIESEAAVWIARRDRGLTASEQDEFFQWLAKNPKRGEWLALHHQTMKGLKLLVQWRPRHGARPNPDLLAAPARRPRWVLPAVLTAAAVLALGLYFSHPAPPIATAQGFEQRMLEDGSMVELDRGAAVDVEFTPAERRVRLLAGEAHFRVAKNPLRPFIVQAASVSVRAVGTAFDVHLELATVSVLVTEGKVQIGSGNRPDGKASVPVTIPAGKLAVVSLASVAQPPHVVNISADEIAGRLAWQPRELNFDSASLERVVEEFNRHNRIKMVIADPAIASLPIGATIRSDNIGGFVRLLEASFGVKAEWRENEILLRRAP